MKRVSVLKVALVLAAIVLMGVGCAKMGKEILPPRPGSEEFLQRPRDPKTLAYQHFLRSSLALSKGQRDKAREYLELALEHDPNSLYLHKKMALLLRAMKDYETALHYAKKASQLSPKDIKL
ncbi:MAG TPA: hypothetical protein EYP06_02915, partial [Desulfobacterales bacterium]|nr:hypothetical protein [Desulfobacterales bacterium]